MKFIIKKDYQDLSAQAADIVIGQVGKNPTSLLVLATGNTPLGMYACLAAAFQWGDISFKSCHLVELDDYFNIPLDDHRNLFNWLSAEFISQVDLQVSNTFRFDTAASHPGKECRRVKDKLAELGGIDLAVLGLGPNGHLGFNEPGSDFLSTTRIISLSPASITSSAKYWGSEEEVPRQGITLGLKTIMSAREILLLVSGRGKSGILKAALQGPITAEVPASILQKHPNLTVIADQDAADGSCASDR
jgi:glucosamine-6-phosphate deaminase